jgi:hypothetical protein
MREMRNANKTLFPKPEGKISLGIPRSNARIILK